MISYFRKQSMSRTLWMLAIAVLLVGAAQCAEAPRVAESGDVDLALTLLTSDGAISAGEPLIAALELTNKTSDDIALDLGPGSAPRVRIAVRDADGAVLAETPLVQSNSAAVSSVVTVKAGESYTKQLVISALYQFEKPGKYYVDAEYVPNSSEDAWASGSAVMNVLPFDPKRLEARCEELCTPLRERNSSETSLSMNVRTKALYSVRHDEALPYWDWMAREWGDKDACLAAQRLGTQKAVALLNSLKAGPDKAATAVRKAETMPKADTDVVWAMAWY
jgi:hypothetical protein